MKKFLCLRMFFLIMPLLFFSNCSRQEPFRYEEKQAVLVRSLREQMFYEYSSPLNDAMKIYLELELANEPDIELPLEKIYETEHKIKQEKPALGCYFVENQVLSKEKKLIIIMEWNQNAGVIIRLFTNSNFIIDKLPNNSF